MTDSFPEHVQLVLRVRILPADISAQARFKRLLKAMAASARTSDRWPVRAAQTTFPHGWQILLLNHALNE